MPEPTEFPQRRDVWVVDVRKHRDGRYGRSRADDRVCADALELSSVAWAQNACRLRLRAISTEMVGAYDHAPMT